MGRIQPLEFGQPLPVEQFADGLEKAELGTEHILQPHGCQSHRTDHVGHVDDRPEGALETDPAGEDRREKERKPHDEDSSEEPDPEDIPHGYAEQLRVEQFYVVGKSRKLPFGYRIRHSFDLKETHGDGAEDRIQENDAEHDDRRRKEHHDHGLIFFQSGNPLFVITGLLFSTFKNMAAPSNTMPP